MDTITVNLNRDPIADPETISEFVIRARMEEIGQELGGLTLRERSHEPHSFD